MKNHGGAVGSFVSSAGPPDEAGARAGDIATLERRAGWSIVLIALSGAVNLVSALHLLSDVEGYDADSPFVLALDLAQRATFLGAVVVFLRWLHRAIVCAKALAPRGQALNVRPSDAVISFFLPIFNLWRPYQKIKRLSDVLDPLELPEPTPEPEPVPVGQYRVSGRRQPAAEGHWPESAPLRLWWCAWLFMSVLARSGARGEASHSTAAFVADGLATFVAALPAVLVIRSISLRLREIARRRSLPLTPKPFYG